MSRPPRLDARASRRRAPRRRPPGACACDHARRERRPAGLRGGQRCVPVDRAARTPSGSPGRPASASRASCRRSFGACARTGAKSASSRSTRRARSPTARCSATASASPTTSSTPASSSARWARAGISGGLAETTLQTLLVLDAAGKDVVFLETVGAGQSEVGIISIADTVVLVLMPGSGDSIQALKAGIMEIPDVIAINKMDHPMAKAMLNEVRQVLSLGPARRLAAADRPHRGDARRGRRHALGEDRGAPRVARGGGRARARAAAATSRRRCSRSRRRARGATSRTTCRKTPSCGALLEDVQARRLDPLTAVREILEQGVQDWRLTTAPTLADIETARERLAGRARVTPVYGSETLVAADAAAASG